MRGTIGPVAPKTERAGHRQSTRVQGAVFAIDQVRPVDALLLRMRLHGKALGRDANVAENQLFFSDREDAGRRLAAELLKQTYDAPVVFALPRGGLPVAAGIAEALGAPLELILVRKIGAPRNPELALAAIVEGDPPERVLNEGVMRLSGADETYLERETERQTAEMSRRRERYLGKRRRIDARGKSAIVVDDGVATGATMKAALTALRRQGAKRLVVAVPVAPASEVPVLRELADEVICLVADPYFRGVGGAYADFHQLSDDETVSYLRRAWTVA